MTFIYIETQLYCSTIAVHVMHMLTVAAIYLAILAVYDMSVKLSIVCKYIHVTVLSTTFDLLIVIYKIVTAPKHCLEECYIVRSSQHEYQAGTM